MKWGRVSPIGDACDPRPACFFAQSFDAGHVTSGLLLALRFVEQLKQIGFGLLHFLDRFRIDLVGSDAKATDRRQRRGMLEHLGRETGVRAYAEEVRVGDRHRPARWRGF